MKTISSFLFFWTDTDERVWLVWMLVWMMVSFGFRMWIWVCSQVWILILVLVACRSCHPILYSCHHTAQLSSYNVQLSPILYSWHPITLTVQLSS